MTASYQFKEGELLLLNKPLHRTSFDVVKTVRFAIRKSLDIKKIKVGHAGTLDPLATGLLILCTGAKTKEIENYMGMEKEYTGTFRLGATTPSYDLETEIDQTFPTNKLTEADIIAATKLLTGTIEQVPPIFSAKRVGGVKSYEKARTGKAVELSARKVEVKEFEITSFNLPDVYFRIVCSKGTYIRSIASDLGKLLNNGGHLTSLCRTRIGNFHLRDAIEPQEFVDSVLGKNSAD